jgi:hypothetical protein
LIPAFWPWGGLGYGWAAVVAPPPLHPATARPNAHTVMPTVFLTPILLLGIVVVVAVD